MSPVHRGDKLSERQLTLAKLLITYLVDDLDESSANETVRFALDGVAYEIDLNNTHAQQLRSALATYVAAARKVPPARNRRRMRSGDRPTTAQVRASKATV